MFNRIVSVGMLLGVGVLFLPVTALGYVSCRDSINGCTAEQLLELSTASFIDKSERLIILQELITKLTAQLMTLKQSTAASAGTPATRCLDLSTNLVPGATDTTTDGAVSKLQQFLREQGHYPNGQITGYYGPLTAEAVVRWQKAHGMDFVTTKSGVGQMTREKMRCRPASKETTETEDPATIRKIDWEIEPVNPYITDENNPKKYEQMVTLNVTYASTTKGYRLGTVYGSYKGSYEEYIWQDVIVRGKNVLGIVYLGNTPTGVETTFTVYRDVWQENGVYRSRLWVEKHEDDAPGQTSGKTTIVLELP